MRLYCALNVEKDSLVKRLLHSLRFFFVDKNELFPNFFYVVKCFVKKFKIIPTLPKTILLISIIK